MANTGTKIYAADQFSIVFGPVLINSGLNDGVFVKIEQDSDSFTKKTGTDGETTRSKTSNRGHKITVTLMQSSDANDLLSAIHNSDLNLPGGVGVLPLLLKDGSGRSLYVAEKAWISKPPSAEFGREASTRDWVLETGALIRLDGGN